MTTTLLQMPPLFWVCATFAFGAILGSFVNAAIYRLPRNISMLTESRSFCPKCKAMIHWYDNVPILSFLILTGKCRGCKQPIPSRYLKVELLVASLCALSAYQFWILNRPSPPTGQLSEMPAALHAVQIFLIADLICATYTDLEMWYIPIETTWPWVILGLILAPVFPELHAGRTYWTGNDRWDALIDSFQGVVYGAGILWGIGMACVVYLKKEGMGGGDAHIVAMIGALLGWKAALETLLIGVTLGAVIGICVILWDRMQRRRLGKNYKPYQPVYEMPDQEEDPGLGPSWPFIAFGAVVLGVQAGLYYVSYRAAPGAWFFFDARHLSALGGGMLGCTFLGGGFVRWHYIKSGKWPKGEIREREDGKKEEVLEGNYLPFGPFLALAGLIVVFYDPLIREYVWWYMLDRYNVPAWMAATGAREVPWPMYAQMNPLPFKVPFGP
ncbi:MAG: prepilin peptidase [Planctomycetota bacterium]|nr:prepilin peptidase [Planctomycetota bacterium]